MASNLEIRDFINLLTHDSQSGRVVMNALAESIKSVAESYSLTLSDQDARDVAKSLLPAVAATAWPNSATTSFELPAFRSESEEAEDRDS